MLVVSQWGPERILAEVQLYSVIAENTVSLLMPLHCTYFFFHNGFIEIKFTYRTIYSFKLQNSMVFSKFAVYTNKSILEQLYHPKKKSWTHE